jgi:hypothetical protein
VGQLKQAVDLGVQWGDENPRDALLFPEIQIPDLAFGVLVAVAQDQ